MDPKITKLIDQYLSGTLEPEALAEFEKLLAESAEIRQEVELQRSIMRAAERASQRNSVKEAARNFKRKRMLRNGGISALIALVATAAILFFATHKNDSSSEQTAELPPISEEVKAKLDERQDFDNIPIQYFQIPEHGSVQLSDYGILISVPEAAFLKDGKPYRKNVILQYQEAVEGIDIVKSGLSTMTGNDLLETGGMFSVAGYTEDGELLDFNPDVGVYIQSPVEDCQSGMMLYNGKKLDNGVIDWVDPEPFSKIPVPVSMEELDFYPEGYEAHLDQEKWNRDKESRDSLYLSLEHTIDGQALEDALNSYENDTRDAGISNQFREPEMGWVFAKKSTRGDSIPSIDQVITWQFESRQIGLNIWDITATARMSDGYQVYSSDIEDDKRRTDLKITENKFVELLSETEYEGTPRTISVKGEKSKGFQNTVVFKRTVKVTGTSQVSVPVRVVFRLSNEKLEYSRVMRRSTVFVGEPQEDRKLRTDSIANVVMEGDFILPSNVMAFWKTSFDNTNLATREFEERMQLIHQLCDNDILEAYTSGLDQPISEIDKKVVRMGYHEFQEFANQNVGKIDADNPHLENLSEFYEKAKTMLQKDAALHAKNEEEHIKQWANIVNEQQELDRKRAVLRDQQYVNGLRNFDRKKLVQQFKNAYGFTIRSGSFNSSIARCNIDRWQPSAAFNGAQAPDSIKTAPTLFISAEPSDYSALQLQVTNADQYLNVYMYLFADGINSYQRLNSDDGNFKCQLNDEISYAVGVVGLTEEGYAYFEADFLKGGDLGNVELRDISEADLEKRIKKMNGKRMKGGVRVKEDLHWLKTQRVHYKKQRLFKNNIEFRREVKAVIFPCVTFRSKDRLRAEFILEETQDVQEE